MVKQMDLFVKDISDNELASWKRAGRNDNGQGICTTIVRGTSTKSYGMDQLDGELH